MDRRDDLAAYLADRDACCPGCGYNLRGLASSQCPECGFELVGLVPELSIEGGRLLQEDQLYEIAAMGSALPAVLSLFTSAIAFSLGLASAFFDQVVRSDLEAADWVSIVGSLALFGLSCEMLGRLLIVGPDEFAGLSRGARIFRAFLVWWWFWGVLAYVPFVWLT
ncbi:MAG: hypothetical protein Phyf2KO_26980 [Phycisphaerales bacterium]